MIQLDEEEHLDIEERSMGETYKNAIRVVTYQIPRKHLVHASRVHI